jgi:hypothetical protein
MRNESHQRSASKRDLVSELHSINPDNVAISQTKRTDQFGGKYIIDMSQKPGRPDFDLNPKTISNHKNILKTSPLKTFKPTKACRQYDRFVQEYIQIA